MHPKNGCRSAHLDPYNLTHDSLGPSESQLKWHLDRFSHLCTDDCRVFLYFTM